MTCWNRHEHKRVEQQKFNEHVITQPGTVITPGNYEYHIQWRSGNHDGWISGAALFGRTDSNWRASSPSSLPPLFSWEFSFFSGDCPQPLVGLTVWVTCAYDDGRFTGEMMRDSGCGKEDSVFIFCTGWYLISSSKIYYAQSGFHFKG